MISFQETYIGELVQKLSIKELLYHDKSPLQEVIIFDNPLCGRVLAIDGCIQTTERDEFVYHEMLVHVPLLAHAGVKKALIIGGGDGGALEELLKHPIDHAALVEVDRRVIDLAQEHLRCICGDAFDDPRVEVIIGDGAKFVAETEHRFDVVLVDAPDPQGPARALFADPFYRDCRRCLAPGGVLVTQNGVPWVQRNELSSSIRALGELFEDVSAYLAPVPTYNGGFLAFGWATDNSAYRRRDLDEVTRRVRELKLSTRYYNPEIHAAAFTLPTYVREILAEARAASTSPQGS